MTKRRQSANRQDAQAAAEHLAIAALGFIAGEPERLGRFLAMTGKQTSVAVCDQGRRRLISMAGANQVPRRQGDMSAR